MGSSAAPPESYPVEGVEEGVGRGSSHQRCTAARSR